MPSTASLTKDRPLSLKLPALLAALVFVLLVCFADRYGFHADELYFLACAHHPIYNNDGVVKGTLRHRRRGFFRYAISLYWKSSSSHKTKTRALLESPMAVFRLHQPSIRSPTVAT